ncbi:MAG TPA: hypothetical protein VMZ29_09245 [Candidatus Bathyarchaeia archaeon]|nr:hypothetical protein [Candidatus Bathyarchaeia archaeon]
MKQCFECGKKTNNLTKCKDCNELFCDEHIYEVNAKSDREIKSFGNYCLACLNEKF